MRNQHAAVSRRLSDPDFQGAIVRACLTSVLVLATLLAVFATHDAWVWTHPPQAKYFVIDGNSTPRPIVPVDSPILDETQLLEWTVRWVLAPYNVNYHDYPQQLNTSGRHYTQNGWNSFAGSYISSGNFEELKKGRLLCFAQAQRSAVIRQTSLIAGHLAYEIQFPLIQTCENVNQQATQNLMMTATVSRVNDLEHPDGLAIDQLIAKPY